MIFAANPDVISFVHRMCCELGDISLYRSPDRYPQAHEAMRLMNGYAPQLLFLEMNGEEAASVIESDIGSFHPATAVVRISRDHEREGPQVLHLACDREEFR